MTTTTHAEWQCDVCGSPGLTHHMLDGEIMVTEAHFTGCSIAVADFPDFAGRRNLDRDDLLDTAAVARMLQVAPGTVQRYRSPDRGEAFPEPTRYYGSTPVWEAERIREWVAARPGRTGRPRRG